MLAILILLFTMDTFKLASYLCAFFYTTSSQRSCEDAHTLQTHGTIDTLRNTLRKNDSVNIVMLVTKSWRLKSCGSID